MMITRMINFFITNKSTYPHGYVLLLVPVTLVHFFLVFHFVCCGVSAWEKIIFSLAKNSPPDCFFTLAFKSGHLLVGKKNKSTYPHGYVLLLVRVFITDL